MPYLNHVLDKGGLGGAGKPRGLWEILRYTIHQFQNYESARLKPRVLQLRSKNWWHLICWGLPPNLYEYVVYVRYHQYKQEEHSCSLSNWIGRAIQFLRPALAGIDQPACLEQDRPELPQQYTQRSLKIFLKRGAREARDEKPRLAVFRNRPENTRTVKFWEL